MTEEVKADSNDGDQQRGERKKKVKANDKHGGVVYSCYSIVR